MKVLILAGGFGTRISEETDIKPKPMVEVGGKPVLWHIMKTYSSYGFNEFVVFQFIRISFTLLFRSICICITISIYLCHLIKLNNYMIVTIMNIVIK